MERDLVRRVFSKLRGSGVVEVKLNESALELYDCLRLVEEV